MEATGGSFLNVLERSVNEGTKIDAAQRKL